VQKRVILFGVFLAILIAALKYLEYSYLVRSLSIEIYMGLLALFFMGLGIWAGINWINKKNDVSISLKTSDEIKSQLGISEREMEVLFGIIEGLTNQQIAEKLFLSESTIKTHSSNLFSKLDVKRRTQAVLEARKIGLVS
jgi:DNA-binding NarL/FixJ family response regulator